MKEYVGRIKIKNANGRPLVRDMWSKGIINTDTASYLNTLQQHRTATQHKTAQVEREQRLDEQITSLTRDIITLKEGMGMLMKTVQIMADAMAKRQ